MGWVSKQVEDVVDFVVQDIPSKIEDEIIEPTKELGRSVDDFVNEEIPGGWYTVAAATGAYFAPEMIAAGNAAESAALASGATTAEAAVAAEAAATAASSGTNFLGSQALGSATTGAVGSGTTGFGLSAGTTAGAAGGTGISTGSLAGTALGAGMGGVGTGASSGLGYLGGAAALPAGTAGMAGVTAPASLSLGDIQRGLRLGNTLFGQQPQMPTPQGMRMPQAATRGMVDYSPTLSLLQQRVSTPNVYSLLG